MDKTKGLPFLNKTYINCQLRLVKIIVEPNIYFYINKPYTTKTNQLLEYRNTPF